MNAEPLLRVENLTKLFRKRGAPTRKKASWIRAVDGISFEVRERETFALVGESGSGKSTTARMILRLEHPTDGRVLLKDRDVQSLRGRALRAYRSSVQVVFQDPLSSLSPRVRVGYTVAEPMKVSGALTRKEIKSRVPELLEEVGLEERVERLFPHELSGGMRQRVALARALSLSPALVVLDEPVSALDVSIRAQIMNLLKDVQEQRGIAYLLIAHDLATVRYLSEHVAVMYMGRIVETAPSEELFSNPLHPYTQALLECATADRVLTEAEPLFDDRDGVTRLSEGCRFAARCPHARQALTTDPSFYGLVTSIEPVLKDVGNGHKVACHLY